MISVTTLGRAKRLLGITVGERSLLIAEVANDPDAVRVTHTVEFPYPPEANLENPHRLGKALEPFLKWHGFSARRAVFGVPAKWLISTRYEMPPTDAKTAADVLYLHASEKIARELGEMVFDYAGQVSATEPTVLLLVGLQRRWMDRVLALAEGAGIKAVAVTPIAAALSSVTALHAGNSLVLSLQSETAELTVQEGGEIRSLRHIAAASIAAELRRTVATTPHRGLAIWDDTGSGNGHIDADGLEVVEAKPQWLEVAASNLIDGRRGLPAAALALALRARERPSLEFLHPRLTPPKVRRFGSRTQWLATAAAALFLAVIVGYADIAGLEHQIDMTNTQLASLSPGLLRASPFVANMRFAEAFKIGRPKFLACLRDLTTALPADGQTYFTDFVMKGDMKGLVVGRSSNEQNVINLTDALSAGGQFAEMNCKLDAHEARGNGNEVAFTLNFTYVPRS
jgi:hypothetical protein